jgi:hypothetical protein
MRRNLTTTVCVCETIKVCQSQIYCNTGPTFAEVEQVPSTPFFRSQLQYLSRAVEDMKYETVIGMYSIRDWQGVYISVNGYTYLDNIQGGSSSTKLHKHTPVWDCEVS